MYAIIVDGGRQYKVEEGQQVLLDYRDVPAGTAIEFDKVLAIRDDAGLRIGDAVSAARVRGETIGIRQGPKLVVQKFRRRKTLRRRTGHRSLMTEVRIQKIDA